MSHSLALSPGQRVGPYTVVAPLRSGGMAALYLARREGPAGFARPVALKVVHAHLGKDPQFVRMFVDEALLCARIRHPNVVHVEELGEHQGAYFLAMEYVDGVSLEDLLDRLCAMGVRMPPRIAVSIACALLEGLQATHTLTGDHGEPLFVVHRDISPSNTLIDRSGHVKLIDFGVAKARGRAIETSAGTLKGKYAYMSPEQAYGRDLDFRSDLYSLGVLLWEMLTMRPLFVADTDLALLERVRAPEVPALSALQPGLPRELEQVLSGALAVGREDRPSSARELKQQLLAALPDARTVDASEVSALLELAFGPASKSPLPDFSSVSSTVAATPPGAPTSSPNAQLSQPANTQPGPHASGLRRVLLGALVTGLLVGLAALGLWWRERSERRALLPAPVSAQSEPRPSPAAASGASADAPAAVAPVAPSPSASAPLPQLAPDHEPARAEPPRETRRGRQRVRPSERAGPAGASPRTRDINGVPLVEDPAF